MNRLLALTILLLLSCGDKESESERIEGTESGDCSDAADNDADGLFDCLDPDCAGAPVCIADQLDVEGEGYCGVLEIVDLACLPCHSPTLDNLGGLDLSADVQAALVDRPSNVDPNLILVVPSDPSASFLINKLVGALGEAQGGPMPLEDPLHANDIQIIRVWILDGATADCDIPGDDDQGSVDYHPSNYDDPLVHGPPLRAYEEDCVLCHGSELDGGASEVSCDGCHEKDWRENCTYCHGGTDTDDGAPPRDLDGATDAAATTFPAHTSHVTEGRHAAYDCVQCHNKPESVTSEGHILDATRAESEVTFYGGLSSAAHYDGNGGCSNLYCHGDGVTSNGVSGAWDETPGCGGCHAGPDDLPAEWNAMSGQHGNHLDMSISCALCHGSVVDVPGGAGTPIIAPELHVNGAVDLLQPGDMVYDPVTGSCSGTCHGCLSCAPVVHYFDPWVDER